MTTREIQLTAKQLVFVFMSTLLAAVVVFLLGVWVGRGIGVESSVAGQQKSGTGAQETTTVASAKDAAGESGKLSYPNLLQGSPSGSQTPPSRPPPEPLPTAPPPVPEAKAAAPPPADPDRSKSAAPAKPPAPAQAGWFVQTDAVSSKANADRRVAELKAKGFDAFVTTGPPFRVRIGPFAQKAAAEQVARSLKDSKGNLPSVIPSR